ncbi:3-oxoacyl-[acyl-carrier-protein] synthase III C-terminal domain-containing protein [Bacillus sp. CECT 9360]|uniref:type III polyketide synthase n=1 Tax=Bacillus sp. CECT 9360 TaxID=2845821 RepID=UPI001E599395|nr:3-oxoacyl-[acyl-carrier-protein] synthase III C-terminal domain-containing protein [Bacillus sp. CECT 9360]CAH0347771.1 Alpha-pyrone synthesis polyketide synthase-like Pks11 [Bacillus sp. CECT 9360]
MPSILSVSHINLPHRVSQESAMDFAREMFGSSFKDIERLLRAFKNGQVDTRYFSNDIEWFKDEHSFEEKNDIYIEQATEYGCKAVSQCLDNRAFLKEKIEPGEIDAFFYISSTGLATPTIDARIINMLSFNEHTKRIPIWGLGCAGGAAGISRAYEYCRAFPKAKVLVLCVELCSLTFQKNDSSKSNLIGSSLFSDGISCALVCGDEVDRKSLSKLSFVPNILATRSTLMPDSLEVMGWDVKNEGLYVVFSKDIPAIIKDWLKPNVEAFLAENQISLDSVKHFVAHPGGRKVIEAYEQALGFSGEMTNTSLNVLKEYGNMSSATIFYVLERFMLSHLDSNDVGLAAALGPGFSSELLLLRWE